MPTHACIRVPCVTVSMFSPFLSHPDPSLWRYPRSPFLDKPPVAFHFGGVFGKIQRGVKVGISGNDLSLGSETGHAPRELDSLLPSGPSPSGSSTQDFDGAVSTRHGSDFVAPQGGAPELPKSSTIARATSLPDNPCILCINFAYDKGQTFFDYEGVGEVSGAEGGFLRPKRHPLFELHSDGGAYDSREYGFCLRSKRRPQLTHRFCTCEEWESKSRFQAKA